jgi:hypothetical protein
MRDTGDWERRCQFDSGLFPAPKVALSNWQQRAFGSFPGYDCKSLLLGDLEKCRSPGTDFASRAAPLVKGVEGVARVASAGDLRG